VLDTKGDEDKVSRDSSIHCEENGKLLLFASSDNSIPMLSANFIEASPDKDKDRNIFSTFHRLHEEELVPDEDVTSIPL